MHRLWPALAAVPALAAAEPAHVPVVFEFEGVVEPVRTVTIANQINAVVDEVHFTGGERVAEGDLLFVLDRPPFEIDVAAARAAVDAAEAELALAEDAAARQTRLRDGGTGSEVRAFETGIASRVAEAHVAERRAELAAAELQLQRTRITAPIAGHIDRPLVDEGAFVEAEGGTALARIVQLDPVLVRYAVPYEARMAALAAAGTGSVDAMFEGVEVTLVLPGGTDYDENGTPEFESARIDPRTGSLTTWAQFPNPDGALVPGLDVTVVSTVSAPGAP